MIPRQGPTTCESTYNLVWGSTNWWKSAMSCAIFQRNLHTRPRKPGLPCWCNCWSLWTRGGTKKLNCSAHWRLTHDCYHEKGPTRAKCSPPVEKSVKEWTMPPINKDAKVTHTRRATRTKKKWRTKVRPDNSYDSMGSAVCSHAVNDVSVDKITAIHDHPGRVT